MAFSVLPHFMIYVGGHIWKNVQRVDAPAMIYSLWSFELGQLKLVINGNEIITALSVMSL